MKDRLNPFVPRAGGTRARYVDSWDGACTHGRAQSPQEIAQHRPPRDPRRKDHTRKNMQRRREEREASRSNNINHAKQAIRTKQTTQTQPNQTKQHRPICETRSCGAGSSRRDVVLDYLSLYTWTMKTNRWSPLPSDVLFPKLLLWGSKSSEQVK
ncbi:hypothetical protein EYC84_000315 [Monilinia fructicola]|uniref:Uncharacterized protein n=1 Tax=Monilinia fructicola TaxID=38448 RepID=A0A5M9JVT6_MONFR|nr:hypothetical protein EYC84_000315 [Monilinia fructicola]